MIYNDDFKKRRIVIEQTVEKAVTEEVINYSYNNPQSLVTKTMGL